MFLAAWPASADTLELLLMPGEVIQGHAKWEDDCELCHKPFDKAAQDHLCLTCHKLVASDIRGAKGFHGKMPKRSTCRTCHTEHRGRAAQIAPLDRETFDHNLTDFPLSGGHTKNTVTCQNCHASEEKYRNAPSRCYACHKKDDIHKGKLGKDCANCHRDERWKAITFDHSTTRFPLRGKHSPVKCQACHPKQRFKNTPRACYACHKKDDDHRGVFGTRCARCHSDKGWERTSFDHDRDTKYRLKGRHKKTTCESCHLKPVAKFKTPRTCIACHRKDDTHKGRFGTRCHTCHTERDWKTQTFDHDRDTAYPLRGLHKKVKCTACHKGNLYKEHLPTACVACHKKNDYHRGVFGAKCEQCHTETDWKVSPFDHDRDTKYPLKGKHQPVGCEKCHTTPVKPGAKSRTCIACHRKDDEHRGHFGPTCKTCHTEADWKVSIFDHDRDTQYPLKGKHRMVQCDSCHLAPLYEVKLQTACYACHQKDDKHRGQEGERCEKCHHERSWKDTTFDHGNTRFPLLGRHQTVKCKSCHSSLAFKDADIECIACHEKEDLHKRRLGTQCAQCHNARDWRLWDFDHDRRTTFPLDGGHNNLDCLACHTEPMGETVTTPDTCGACHTHDDVHEGEFGQRCERCHYTSEWNKIKPKARFSR